MSAGSYRNSEGKTLYEEFPGGFEAGGVLNVGSCVANSHIAGAAIKVANIFAKRSLRGNYEEIADYIHNRLGAVGLAWGAYSQKAAAIGAGFWRLGIPVLVGPHGSKVPSNAPWAEKTNLKTGKSTMHVQATKLMLDPHLNTSSTQLKPKKNAWLQSQNSALDQTTLGKDAA